MAVIRVTRTSVIRGGLRGLVAAMAMTGTRTVTASVGSQEKTPPEAIVERHAPETLTRLPQHHREAITEILHWTYGSGGGALFGMLPARLRRRPWIGPVYGLAFWLGFELGIAPLLGVERGSERRLVWPALIAVDHLLYGVVVSGQLAPEPSIYSPPRGAKAIFGRMGGTVERQIRRIAGTAARSAVPVFARSR